MTAGDFEFPDCLRMYRARNRMTQAELGEMVGVTDETIANWESGSFTPSLKTAIKIADVFGVTLDQLIGRERRRFKGDGGDEERT